MQLREIEAPLHAGIHLPSRNHRLDATPTNAMGMVGAALIPGITQQRALPSGSIVRGSLQQIGIVSGAPFAYAQATEMRNAMFIMVATDC